MKRILITIFIGLTVMTLSSCKDNTETPKDVGTDNYTLSIYNGELLVEEHTDVVPGTAFDLEYLDETDQIFGGWSDGTNIYFDSAVYLETLDLGETLINIGDSAFMNTQLLKVIELPATVEFFGMYTLLGSSVDTIIINRDATANSPVGLIGSINPLDHEEDDISIYVLDQDVETYKTTQWWSRYEEHIFPISSYTEE